MHLLSVQIQPDLAPALDIAKLSAAFEAVAANKKLVLEHDFDGGADEDGPYFNFTFSTLHVARLWAVIQANVFADATFEADLESSAIAMCTGKDEWNDYLLLFHFDPDEVLDEPPPAITLM